MPVVQANGIEMYYEVQGEGEPLVLIPYLAADQACYAFQVADYAKHFTCYTVDLRGAGLSGKPEGTYTTELLADDVAAFMHAAGIENGHVFGLSLGAATGMFLAAKYPELVKSLSLHSAWDATDPSADGGRRLADHGPGPGKRHRHGDYWIFPWRFTGVYAARPEYIQVTRRLRSQPPHAASGHLHAPVRRRTRA